MDHVQGKRRARLSALLSVRTLACVAALLAACETRPPPAAHEPAPGAASPGAAAGASAAVANAPAARPTAASPIDAIRQARGGAAEAQAAAQADDDGVDAALPQALPVRAVGTFVAAPWLAGAERVAILRQRRRAYVVAAGSGWLRVFDPAGKQLAEAPGEGSAQVLEILDTRGQGRPEIVVGRGRGRDAMDAPASVTFYRFDGRRLSASGQLTLPPSSRAQVVSVAGDPVQASRVYIGVFDSQYHASLLVVDRDRRGRLTTRELERVRVPAAITAGDPDGDGKTDVIVARPYGDTREAPGDVFLLREDRERTTLPIVRGARAVAVSGGDVVYADGWHRMYARKGRGLISRARWDGGAFQTEILAHVAGRFGYDRIRMGDVDGDGRPDAVAAGNGPAILVRGLEPVAGFVPTLGSVEATDVFLGDLDGEGRDVAVIAGPSPGIWRYTE